MPGMDWNITISFLGNDKTYRVWSRSNEDPHRILLKRANGPLSWRQMVTDIDLLDEIGLSGDLLNDIEISGLNSWQASLLKMAWCKFDGPAESQLKFLMGLPDKTISMLESTLGNFIEPEFLEALDTLIEQIELSNIPMMEVDRAIAESMNALPKGLDQWLNSMCDWCKAHAVNVSLPMLSLEQAINCKSSEALQNLTTMESPIALDIARVLLVTWLNVDAKPVQESAVFGIRFRSTILFLEWLFFRLKPGAFTTEDTIILGNRLRIIDEVDAHISAEILRLQTSRGGGEFGRGVRGAVISRWVDLRRQIFGGPHEESI